jgi:hypothetical protein
MGIDAVAHSVAPLLEIRVGITNTPEDEPIQSVLLTAQIQIQAPQRRYTADEKEKLLELFGPPDDWGRTLRNRFWTHANTTVGPFNGATEAILPVPCTADLNVTASKYFYALEDGEVSLLFLFSGSVFYTAAGRLQISPISWNKECAYRMQVRAWHELMERHYPNTAWLSLRRDIFERLYAHKRRHTFISWEQTIEHLLQSAGSNSAKNGPAEKDAKVAV